MLFHAVLDAAAARHDASAEFSYVGFAGVQHRLLRGGLGARAGTCSGEDYKSGGGVQKGFQHSLGPNIAVQESLTTPGGFQSPLPAGRMEGGFFFGQ